MAPSPWWLLTLASLPLFTLWLHFRGEMVLGWDSVPPLRPDLYIAQAFSNWNWARELGQPHVLDGLAELPLGIAYFLLALPFGLAVAQKFVLVAIFVLPAFAMYFCARRLFPRAPWLWFIAGWCYALSPLLFVRYYIPIVPVQIAYAMLPLLVNAWVDVARRGGDARRLLGLALAQFALLPSSSNVAYWIVPQAAGLLLAAAIAVGKRDQDGNRKWSGIARGIAIVAAINAFWFVPQALFGAVEGSTYAHESVQAAYTAGIRKDVAANSSASYTMRLTSRAIAHVGDANGPYWTDAAIFRNPVYAATLFVWIGLALVAIARRPRDPRRIGLGLLLVLALFIMKGTGPPLAALLALAYRLPLLGTVFRDGFDKLLPMAAFAIALLAPLALAPSSRRRDSTGAWVLAGCALLLAYPYWTGQMFMARPAGPSLASIPPNDAYAIARATDRNSARTLFLPPSGNAMLTATNWGYFGENPFIWLARAPLISTPLSVINRPQTDAVTSALYRAVERRDVVAFRLLARILRVGYVLVAHDVNFEYYGGPTPRAMDAFLGELGDTRVTQVIGPYTLWRLAWVPDRSVALARRQIVAYDASFAAALNVVGACGRFARSALVAGSQATGVCTLRRNVIPPSAWMPMTFRLRDGYLRVRANLRTPAAAVWVGRDASAASLGGVVAGTTRTAVPLVPCLRFAYAAFAPRGPTRTIAIPAAPVGGGGVDVTLPALRPGFQDVRVLASVDRSTVAAEVVDANSAQVMARTKGLATGSNGMTFYALPGRTYRLRIAGAVAFGSARADVLEASVRAVRRSKIGALRAPAAPGQTCPARSRANAFATRDRGLDVALAIEGKHILVRTYGIEPPFDVAKMRLPPGTKLLRTGSTLIDRTAIDTTFAPGFTVRLQGYRPTGPARTLRVTDLSSSGPVLVTDLDPRRGRMTLQTGISDQWVRFPLPELRPGPYALTIASGGLVGQYGAAVTNVATDGVAASRRNVSGPKLAFAFYALPGQRYQLYIYTVVLPGQTTFALRVSSMTLQPIRSTGLAQFTLPRVVATVDSDPDAVLVSGRLRRGPLGMTGSHVSQYANPTALVLRTQYDPFWLGFLLSTRPPFIMPLHHVVADGYANAWIVPAMTAGRFTAFYLLDAFEYLGLALALVALFALIARSRKRGARL